MSTRRFRYDPAIGEVVEVTSSAPNVRDDTSGVAVTFRPHVAYDWDRHAARFAGCKQVDGMTHVETQGQLNKLMEFERARGREVHWKAH